MTAQIQQRKTEEKTDRQHFFWYSAVHNEEQRPLLQDILEAAVDDRRQAAVDVEEQRPQLQAIFKAAIDGNHVLGK